MSRDSNVFSMFECKVITFIAIMTIPVGVYGILWGQLELGAFFLLPGLIVGVLVAIATGTQLYFFVLFTSTMAASTIWRIANYYGGDSPSVFWTLVFSSIVPGYVISVVKWHSPTGTSSTPPTSVSRGLKLIKKNERI
jgi:hypothetical protein